MSKSKYFKGISLLEVAMVLIIICLSLVFVRNDEGKFNNIIMNKNTAAWMTEVADAAEMYFSSMDTEPSSTVKINTRDLVNNGFLSAMFNLPVFLQVDIYATPFLKNTTTPHFNVLTVFRLNENNKVERNQVSAMLGSEGGGYIAKEMKIYGNRGGWVFDAKDLDVKEADVFSFRKVDAKIVSGGIKSAELEGGGISRKGSDWEWEIEDNTSSLTIILKEWSGFYQWNVAITKQFDFERLFSIDADGQSKKIIYHDVFDVCRPPEGWYMLHLSPKQHSFNFSVEKLKTLSLNIYIKRNTGGEVKC